MLAFALATLVRPARAAPVAADRGDVVALPTLGVTVALPSGATVQADPERVLIDLGPLDSVQISRIAEKPTFAEAVSNFVRDLLSVHGGMFGDSDYVIEGDAGYGQVHYHRVRSFPNVGSFACSGQVQQQSPDDPSIGRVRSLCESIAVVPKP